ncbi:MAG TPA: GWxTD domain-containing protein [Bacteroidales bacterium]|nr:GWxTD domain-containing protein [Bacteroidales bacterium]
MILTERINKIEMAVNKDHKNIGLRSFFLPGIILIFLFFLSCSTSRVTFDPKDLSYLYNPTKNLFYPQYYISNRSDDITDLSVMFPSDQLFFSEANPQGIPLAEMLITVKLYNISGRRMLADTAFYNLSIPKDGDRPEYVYNIPLKVSPGMEYTAEVKIVDRLRNDVVQTFVPFNTLSYNNRYNFRVLDYFSGKQVFKTVLKPDEFINLIHLTHPPDSIYVSYYRRFTEIPDPPSMIVPERTIDYGPDTIVPLPYSDTLPLNFPNEGIYQISTGREIKEGYTLLNLGSVFPEMNTPEIMIEPLAYLTDPAELDSLFNAPDPKLALDEFWIGCGGNIERARELIRIYYTRVLYANRYFTSYKEGWRTERGMIYIIYGPPDKVYKTTDGEDWGYRKPVIKSRWGNRYTVNEEFLYFTFREKDSDFSDNDYYLSRNESLITYWAQAVASWKRGIVFRLDNPADI